MKPYFLSIVEINSWMDPFNQMLEEQLEVVALLAFEQQALHCALTVLYPQVDGPSLGVEERDDGLEDGPFGLIVLQGQLEVLILSDQVLKNHLLVLFE